MNEFSMNDWIFEGFRILKLYSVKQQKNLILNFRMKNANSFDHDENFM